MSSNGLAIRTVGLTKFYGAQRGIEGVELEVRAGEVFGFLGPNGAGKTTTIRILLDLLRPSSGTAQVLGLETHDGSIEIRKRVGYLPGEPALYEDLTVAELLAYFASLREPHDPALRDELAERLELDTSRRVGALSRGNKQKVGLVQALMHRPELLILDEPTSGLDPLIQHEFLTILREVAAKGRTVFLSSHVLSEVEHVADRVGIIRNGRLAIVESVGNLKARSLRTLRIRFGDDVVAGVFQGLPGVREAAIKDRLGRIVVEGSVDAVIKEASRHEVLDIVSHEADLEEIFLTYYRDGGDAE